MSYSSGILNHLFVRARELISSEGNVMNFDLRCFPLDESTIIETCYPFKKGVLKPTILFYIIKLVMHVHIHVHYTHALFMCYINLFRNYKIFYFYHIFNSGT